MHRITKIAALGATALAATAVIATAPAANASVTYDDARVGSVGKGDVQTLLGLNDAKLQTTTVKFTNKLVSVTDNSWTCTDGGTYHNYRTVTSIRPLDATALKNPSGKITGWTLNGFSKTDFGTVTGATSGDPIYVCPTGTSFTGLNVAVTIPTNIVQANGIDLPVTPAEAPVA